MNDIGSIFIHHNFAFKDGETGKKLMVILGNFNNHVVVAKTTSKQHDRGITYGCQPSDRFHNFYLPQGSCFFQKCTWICLDEFFEFTDKDLLEARLRNELYLSGKLENHHLSKLQNCALKSLDISEKQEQTITESLNELKDAM